MRVSTIQKLLTQVIEFNASIIFVIVEKKKDSIKYKINGVLFLLGDRLKSSIYIPSRLFDPPDYLMQ